MSIRLNRARLAPVEDDALIAPASPWPVASGHLMAVLLHLVDGALLLGVVLWSPPWAGENPLAVYSERFAEVTAADLQWSVAGMVIFATLIAIVASTGFTVAAFRVLSTFRRLQEPRRSAVLFAALAVAHALGCAAGIAAAMLASGVAFVG